MDVLLRTIDGIQSTLDNGPHTCGKGDFMILKGIHHHGLLAAAALSIACSAFLHASETPQWTRFRGPNGTGISSSTAVPASWSEKEYNWQVTLPGSGHSSPVVWNDKVFVTCAERDTGTMIFLCLKTGDGSVLWKRAYQIEKHRQNRDNSYASSTPAVDKDRIYYYWASHETINVLALDHGGREVWRRTFDGFKSLHGSGPSPCLYQDLLIIPNDQMGPSSVFALDVKTGKTRWTLKRKSGRAAYAAPCIYTPDNGAAQLILTAGASGISSIDPETGKLNWDYKDAFPQRVVSSPIAAGDTIIGTCGQGGRGVRLTAVTPGTSTSPAKLAYQIRRRIPYVPTPLFTNELVFAVADSGDVKCFKPDTGEIVWEAKLREKFYSSPVCAAGRIYVASKTGTMFIFDAAASYKLHAKFPLGEGCFATPAVADGVMYIRTFSKLLSIGGKR